jgi:ProP effector
MKSMNTMSPVAELPEATENATHATPDATPGNGAPQAPAPEADAHDAGAAPAAAESTAPAPAAGADVQSPRALLKHLQQQFKAFRDCLPLAIGIDKQVLARLPGLNRKTMRAALGIHTGSMRYLRAMEKATVRYDLDGNPGAEVTDTHRQHAKELLQERFKKEAERKKAERDAAAQVEADRKRQEKLQQLATKFAKR